MYQSPFTPIHFHAFPWIGYMQMKPVRGNGSVSVLNYLSLTLHFRNQQRVLHLCFQKACSSNTIINPRLADGGEKQYKVLGTTESRLNRPMTLRLE